MAVGSSRSRCPRESPIALYVAPGSGNLFRSDDGGLTWTPVFEHQPTHAIGCVEVAPSDPDVVWVGTGEAHLGGVSWDGQGVFRSDDGGESWRAAGLADARRIGKVAVRRIAPEVELQRIGFRRDATLAYWAWLAAGLGVGVDARLLRVAEARQGQLEGRVSRGVMPRVDLTDNERLIVDRRIRLRGAERDAEQAAIALSLFLRDADGNPLVATTERLPGGFPPEDEPRRSQLPQDIERAESGHPLLRALAYEIESAEVDLELARNESLPAVDLRIEGSRDFGAATPGISSEGSISPNPRGQGEVRALLRFELPVLRREALGRAQAARAKLSRLESERRFAQDRITAKIRRAMAGLEAAWEQTLAARRNLELARELEAAEERKLLLGTSNLINVNIRELQTAEGNRALIEAQAEYFQALAEYRAAVAVGS